MTDERCQKLSSSHVSSAYKRIQVLKLCGCQVWRTPYAILFRHGIEIRSCRRPKETRESGVASTLRNCAVEFSATCSIGLCKDHRCGARQGDN